MYAQYNPTYVPYNGQTGRRRSITESTYTYPTEQGVLTEKVTKESFAETQGNIDVTRSYIRRSSLDYATMQNNPYSLRRYNSRDKGIDQQRQFGSQTSLSSQPATTGSRRQPFQVSVYTTSRQRRRGGGPKPQDQSRFQAQPAVFQRPPSRSESRRSSVTSIEYTRPLHVTPSWESSAPVPDTNLSKISDYSSKTPSLHDNDPSTILFSPTASSKISGPPESPKWKPGMYGKDIYPTPDEVRNMAKLVSQSLFDPRNRNAKGGRMFQRRMERAEQYSVEGYGKNQSDDQMLAFVENWTNLEDLQARAKKVKMEQLMKSGYVLPPHCDPDDILKAARPHSYTYTDPITGARRTVEATNFDVDLKNPDPCSHDNLAPGICLRIVEGLRSDCGRGSAMFRKRLERSHKWVTDETNCHSKSYGVVEAIKAGKISERALQNSLRMMEKAQPKNLPTMASVTKKISPWEAAAQGLPMELPPKPEDVVANMLNNVKFSQGRFQPTASPMRPPVPPPPPPESYQAIPSYSRVTTSSTPVAAAFTAPRPMGFTPPRYPVPTFSNNAPARPSMFKISNNANLSGKQHAIWQPTPAPVMTNPTLPISDEL